MWFASGQQGRKHLFFFLFCKIEVSKVFRENQSGTVLIIEEKVETQLLPEELGGRRMEQG